MENFDCYFPYKNLGIIYFDNATTTQLPINTITFLKNELDNVITLPKKGYYRNHLKQEKQIEDGRLKIANFLGVDPDEIFFTFGASNSLGIIADIINYNFGLNGEILFNDDDHESILKSISQIKMKKNIYRLFPHSGDADWRDINHKNSKKTRAIFVNHIHGKYGLQSEVEKIEKKNALLILDISQSVSKIKIDLHHLKADFAFFSANKIFGLNGCGVLFISKNVSKKIKINFTKIREIERNISWLSLLSLFYGIKFVQEIGIRSIHHQLINLTQYAISKLRKIKKINFLPGPAFAECITGYGILSFYISNRASIDILPLLEENKIIVRLGRHCYKNDSDYLRISFHINNNNKEIDKLFDILNLVQ